MASHQTFRIFIFILLFAPLAFGTVEQWSLSVIETSVFLALLLFSLRKGVSTPIYEIPGIIPLLLILVYIGIQCIPLPSEIIRIISPSTYTLYAETTGVYEPFNWISLSIDKKATINEFFRISAYAFFYVLTVQLLTKKELLKRTVTIVVLFASFLSLLALLQHLLWNNKIFWFRELTQGGSPFGPYVNRNHYAGLMEMIFPIVLSLTLVYKPKVMAASLRERIYEFLNQERTNIYFLLAFASIMIATTVFVSLSRGGIVSLSLSMIFLGGLLLIKEAHKRRGILVISLSLLIVLSVGWFGWEPIFERFEAIRNPQGDISEHRLVIWKDSLHTMKDFPLTGTGFGSFIDIYPKYRTWSGDKIADHAHNDYLELFTDGGVIALFLYGWFALSVLYNSFKTFTKRREIYSIYLFIGSTSGIIAILIHSISDFNLHIGANGLYFFFLLGLAVSAANTRLRDELGNTCLKKISLPSLRNIFFLSTSILLLSLLFNVGGLLGKFYFSFVKDVKLDRTIKGKDLLTIKNIAHRASFFDPLGSDYHYVIANTEILSLNRDTALYHYKKAISLDPVNGKYLQRLGLMYSGLKRADVAERLLRAGITYDMRSPLRYKTYALWLLSNGKKEKGLRFIKEAISLEPEKTKDYITIMVLYRLEDGEIMSSLPERTEPHLLFADYLKETGKDEMAKSEYLKALEYIKNEVVIKPSYFHEVYRYFEQRDLFSDALQVMQKAVELFPDDLSIRIHIAGAYEKVGMTYKAIEEYEKALTIDPRNKRAKKRLEEIKKSNGDS